jgi:hypothetical protein
LDEEGWFGGTTSKQLSTPASGLPLKNPNRKSRTPETTEFLCPHSSINPLTTAFRVGQVQSGMFSLPDTHKALIRYATTVLFAASNLGESQVFDFWRSASRPEFGGALIRNDGLMSIGIA